MIMINAVTTYTKNSRLYAHFYRSRIFFSYFQKLVSRGITIPIHIFFEVSDLIYLKKVFTSLYVIGCLQIQ